MKQQQRRLDLLLKKQRLQIECAAQRQQLAAYVEGLQPLFSTADKVTAGALWLKQHPALVAASSAALFILRPRFLVRLGMRGYSAWQLFQTFRGRKRH